jgi:acyl-homoserine-lactone acylase
MMQARSLDEWKDAMRMRGRASSNFTYADADGNIFYVWNSLIPELPHASGGDTASVPAATSADIFTRLVPWDSLPHVENPPGGYLHNENDPFHFTNLNAVLRPADFPAHFPRPQLRFRSQLGLRLVEGDERLSLEDVVARKHDMSMLLAERVKDDLLAAVRSAGSQELAGDPHADRAGAVALLEGWDNTVSRDARGALLFKTWWDRYVDTGERAPSSPASAGMPATPESLFRVPWSFDEPAATPRGLADPDRAAAALDWAVASMRDRWGRYDIPWGEVHRARLGDQDYAVGGCEGYYGCFRVLTFTEDDDGRFRVRGGDGWVVAVEFTEPVPRAYSVLAYGLSPHPDHPYFANQLELFASNEMKMARVSEADIRANAIRSYRPGR